MYNYSSCVPPIDTCLDGVCVELEKLDPSLCPQDCYNNEKGEMQYSRHTFFRNPSAWRLKINKTSKEGQLTGMVLDGRPLNWIDFLVGNKINFTVLSPSE